MTANTINIETKIADCDAELRAAEALRYEVFVAELGGDGAHVDHDTRLERDAFDAYADHLIAIDRAADDKVIGVYRLLRGDMADKAGGFYSEDEYDVTALKTSGKRLLELGRSCVHPDYRGGIAMYNLWQGLADYVWTHEIEILFGVASFHGTDPTRYAHALSHLAESYMAPDDLRPLSKAYEPMALMAPDQIDRAQAIRDTPALIKSYLRLGGVVGDGGYIDHAFNTIDVCLIMETAKMSDKYRAMYSKARRP